ncbi:MAG: tRNA pseudouridine(13) synthase TruD, partial [Woeseia sp.]
NTLWIAKQLARFAGIPLRDVGYSGLKDRHAVTTQWFSVRRARGQEHVWTDFKLDGVVMRQCVRHCRKLRRGTHRANRFDLTLRNVTDDPRPALDRIAANGVPNYFGEQRFGHGGGNVLLAGRLFAGQRLKREQRSLALSAARSLIFNDVLDARLAAGNWDVLLPGDIASLEGSNSHFPVDTVDETLAERCRQFDVHPSGPMWGRNGQADARSGIEQEVLARHTDFVTGLERHGDAARRSLRLIIQELESDYSDDTLRLQFTLQSGSFATAVLRELAVYNDGSRESAVA